MREMSRKNPYWISKNRKLELKYFCLQYYEWKQSLDEISFFEKTSGIKVDHSLGDGVVPFAAEKRLDFIFKIGLVENAAEEAAGDLAYYILLAATKELNYDNLRLMHDIPCCRNEFYRLYRKFFYILSERKP